MGSDPALSGSLLRHANSRFFGSVNKAVTVRDAIVRLGVKRSAELVILTAQKQLYGLKDPKLQAVADELWRHAVGCAVGTQWLAGKANLGNRQAEAFLAGLLHGIRGRVDANLAATAEAQSLRVSEVQLAQLEIMLEDAMLLAD